MWRGLKKDPWLSKQRSQGSLPRYIQCNHGDLSGGRKLSMTMLLLRMIWFISLGSSNHIFFILSYCTYFLSSIHMITTQYLNRVSYANQWGIHRLRLRYFNSVRGLYSSLQLSWQFCWAPLFHCVTAKGASSDVLFIETSVYTSTQLGCFVNGTHMWLNLFRLLTESYQPNLASGIHHNPQKQPCDRMSVLIL